MDPPKLAAAGVRTTIFGYVCPWCRGVYPSLYWFKRDRATGTTVCGECSPETGSTTFADLLPTSVPDDELFTGRRSWSWVRLGQVVIATAAAVQAAVSERWFLEPIGGPIAPSLWRAMYWTGWALLVTGLLHLGSRVLGGRAVSSMSPNRRSEIR